MYVLNYVFFTFQNCFSLAIQQVALVVTCYSCNACSSVSSSTGTASNTYCYVSSISMEYFMIN